MVAVQTLGQWRGASRPPEALAVLKQLAESGGDNWNSWEHLAARTARTAIAAHLQPADMQWAFDWLLRHQPQADMWSVVAGMPTAQVLVRPSQRRHPRAQPTAGAGGPAAGVAVVASDTAMHRHATQSPHMKEHLQD